MFTYRIIKSAAIAKNTNADTHMKMRPKVPIINIFVTEPPALWSMILCAFSGSHNVVRPNFPMKAPEIPPARIVLSPGAS